MNCRVCKTEIIETDGVYLIGGDLCHLHYWQENQDSPYFPLSGYSREDFETKTP